MGTRSLTHVKDETGTTLVTIYRQYDGYPSGMGTDIAKAFEGKTLVNGYSDPETQINGMGCAAATLIASIKDGCGNVYVAKPDTSDRWEDFTYFLSPHQDKDGTNTGKIYMECRDYDGNTVFAGALDEFDGHTVEAQMYGDEDAA